MDLNLNLGTREMPIATTSNALAKPITATAIQIVASRRARVIKRLDVALEVLAMVEVEATGEGTNQTWTQTSTLKPKASSLRQFIGYFIY